MPRTTDADASPKNVSVGEPLVEDETSTIMVLGSAPVRMTANKNSFQVVIKAKSATTARPGTMMGKITRSKACKCEQPSMSAASSISFGTSRMKPIMSQTAKGI